MNIEEINKQYVEFYGEDHKGGINKSIAEKIEKYKGQIRELESIIELNEALITDDELRVEYGNKSNLEINEYIKDTKQKIKKIKANLQKEKQKLEKTKAEIDAAIEQLKNDPEMERYIDEILAKRYDRKLKAEEDTYIENVRKLKKEKIKAVKKFEKEKNEKEIIKSNIELLKETIKYNKSLQFVVDETIKSEKDKQDKIKELVNLDKNDKDYSLKVEDIKKQIKNIDKNNKSKKEIILEEIKVLDEKFTIDDLNLTLKALTSFKTEKYEIIDKDGNKIQKERDIDVLTTINKASKSYERELKNYDKKKSKVEATMEKQIETEKEDFEKNAQLYFIAMKKLGFVLENAKSKTGEYASELVKEDKQKNNTKAEISHTHVDQKEVTREVVVDGGNTYEGVPYTPEKPKWWQFIKRIKNWYNRKNVMPIEKQLEEKTYNSETKVDEEIVGNQTQEDDKESNQYINSIKYKIVEDLINDKNEKILAEAKKEMEQKSKEELEVGE